MERGYHRFTPRQGAASVVTPLPDERAIEENIRAIVRDEYGRLEKYRCEHCSYRSGEIDYAHVCEDGYRWLDHISEVLERGTYPWLVG